MTAKKQIDHLVEGDVVDIIAPASACSLETYTRSLEALENLGLKARVREFEELIDESEIYCSNSLKYRFDSFVDAVHSDSKAIWCLCGGYGSGNLLALIDEMQTPEKQKTLIGFSDITMLLNYVADKWGWRSIYGPNLDWLALSKISPESASQLRSLIFGVSSEAEVKAVEPLNDCAHFEGLIESEIVGGCMSLLQTFISTSYAPSMAGKILFIEDDRYEAGARLDRIFDHFSRSNFIDDIKAVILGDFMEGPKSDSDLFRQRERFFANVTSKMQDLRIPVLFSPNLGHVFDMVAMPLGTKARLKLGKTPHLSVSCW